MDYLTHKRMNRSRRINRVRAVVAGSSSRPRLTVHVSNQHVVAQIVDDELGKTLAYSTTVGRKLEGNLSVKAAWVGTDIAKKAQKAKVKKVVFDSAGRKYHGRIKSLAEAARQEGLEF